MNKKLLYVVSAVFISSSSFPQASILGYIDTVWYFHPDLADWCYPNDDSNTIVMQLFQSKYPCSLIGVGIEYCSAGWAELYVWEGPDPLPSTTEELTESLYNSWNYDSVTNNWESWPAVLYGPDSIGSDEPGDLAERYCWLELDPKIDIGTSYVWVGYKIVDDYNPDGRPYGGKPWSVSDCWIDPLGQAPRFEPCRTWMYRERPGHSRDNQWIGYGNEMGDWAIKYVIDIYGTGIEEIEQPYIRFSIFQSTPNPFTERVSLKYQLAQASDVYLAIYNLLGQEVRTLLNEHQDSGLHTVIWNGQDNSGGRVPSGTYFLGLQAGQHTATRKVCVVR